MQSSTTIGVLFAVTGNLLISIGLNLQKTSHYLRSFKWWVGFTLMTYGEIENFIAYGYIPVVMVSSLGIVTLISNVIIAPALFSQKLRLRDLIGTFLASIGVVLIIFSLNDAMQVDDPIKFFDDVIYSLNFIGYFIGSLVGSVGLMIRQDRDVIQNLIIVAIFGSYTVISTKLLSVLIEYSFSLIIHSYKPWILFVVIIVTSCLQIKYLNIALSLNSSTVVIPLHYIFFNLTIIASSIIVFKDFSRMSLMQALQFIVGISLTFMGVISICGDEDIPVVHSTNNNNNNQIPYISIDEPADEGQLRESNNEPVITTGLIQRAKSTSELLLNPIRSINSNRRNSDSSGSHGTMIVGSGLIVNTFINYANTTTGVTNIDIDTNSHD